MNTARSVIRRLEFAPLRLDPVATLTARIDERDASVLLFLDGVPLGEVRIWYNYEEEGRQREARHELIIQPYRTSAEWDAGPTVEALEPIDAPAWLTERL
jgi:hypothetical protein